MLIGDMTFLALKHEKEIIWTMQGGGLFVQGGDHQN